MKISQMIDHTLLRPDATMTEIEQLCREAVTLDMASVCVNGTWVATCADLLRNSGVNACTVVGFPLGAMATEAKAHEAQVAAEQGATEIDMVLNIGAVKDANWTLVTSDIAAVVAALGISPGCAVARPRHDGVFVVRCRRNLVSYLIQLEGDLRHGECG